MAQRKPFMVPATLQRLRCFLNTEGGLKVRPWAGADEVLDSFHDALRSRRGDDRFWERLQELLAALAEDTARRGHGRAAGTGNTEVLSPERRGELLGELRRALAARRRGQGRFCRLARTVSAPALGLLLMLGGVAAVGCYGSHGEDGENDTAADTTDAHDGTAADDAAAPDTRDTLDDAVPPDSVDTTDETVPEVSPDACVPGTRSFEELVAACVPDGAQRDQILACVAALHESWRTRLGAMLECEPCYVVADQLQMCLLSGWERPCEDPADAGTFDEEAFLDNCSVLLYLGVRFE